MGFYLKNLNLIFHLNLVEGMYPGTAAVPEIQSSDCSTRATPQRIQSSTGAFGLRVAKKTYVGPRKLVTYTGQSYDIGSWRM